MIDVFNEEIEILIKEGTTHLYWFHGDLKKSWLKAGVKKPICDKIFNSRDPNGQKYSKRNMMDLLYERLRTSTYNTRLEISRNFVRFLVDHKSFTPQDPKHRIENAERVALKLKDIINTQRLEKELSRKQKQNQKKNKENSYSKDLALIKDRFIELSKFEDKQKRGYEFEKLFTSLMKVSKIKVEEPFKITGEQIDGAIKYDGHYYLIELKWTKDKANQGNISSLYVKAEGKLDAKGIFIALEGYSNEVLESLPKGKSIKVILLHGVHISNVLWGNYSFKELMEYALQQASLKGNILCDPSLKN